MEGREQTWSVAELGWFDLTWIERDDRGERRIWQRFIQRERSRESASLLRRGRGRALRAMVVWDVGIHGVVVWLFVCHIYCCCLITLTAALAHGDLDGSSRRKCRSSRRASTAEAAAAGAGEAARKDSGAQSSDGSGIRCHAIRRFRRNRVVAEGLCLAVWSGRVELGELEGRMLGKERKSSCRHKYVHVASIWKDHSPGRLLPKMKIEIGSGRNKDTSMLKFKIGR